MRDIMGTIMGTVGDMVGTIMGTVRDMMGTIMGTVGDHWTIIGTERNTRLGSRPGQWT